MSTTLSDLARLVQGIVVGDGSLTIPSLSPIDDIAAGSLVYAEGEENLKKAAASQAAAVLVSDKVEQFSKPLIKVSQPFKAFICLLQHFNPSQKKPAGIHPTAVIAEGVQVGEQVTIGPYVIVESGSKIGNHTVLKGHVHIGHNVTIGDNSTLYPHVTVYDQCEIGSGVVIHASTVVGSDGFGYTFIDGQHLKVPHVGKVIIEDDVEIGANTTIDRATMGATVIGKGTKIDNLVQIAHSVKLGKHNILCAFTGIAGSSTTGDYVVCAANVGVSDHVNIGDKVVLGARAGVPPNKNLKEGEVYYGSPARLKEVAIKHELAINRIPLIRKNIKTLTEQVAQLNKRFEQQEAE